MRFSLWSLPTRITVLSVCLSLWSTVFAESILDTYRLALENDPRFLSAQAIYRADLQKLPQARAAWRPNINGTADLTRNELDVATDSGIVSRPQGGVSFDRTNFELSLSQTIYNRSLSAAVRQAHAEVRRANAQLAAARQDLIIRVAEAYFSVLAAMDNVDLAMAEKKANKRQLEVAEGRLEVGLATITDVHDARARFELARAQEIEADNTLRDRRQALRETTGRIILDLPKIDRNAPLVEPDPPDIEQWVQTAIKQDPTLVAARETAQTALEEVKRQRAGRFPTLNLVGIHSDTDDSASVTGPSVETERTEIGLQLSVPIYQGGLISSLSKEAGHRYNAAKQDVETQVRVTERSTRAAFLGVVGGASRIRALRQAVIASESALEGKREGFEAGIGTNLDVLDARRDLFLAARDLLGARYNFILNLFRLKRAAGILSEQDLVRINRWLK